eukprot:318633_1
MDKSPFHKLCYSSSVTTKQISEYLNGHGNDAALTCGTLHGMTPLHILSMNPHSTADAILTLLKADINAASVKDHEGKTPLYYVLYYNPCAFVRMYSYLRDHTNTNTIDHEIQSSWGGVDPDDGDIPLCLLTKNPLMPANDIAALLEMRLEDVFCQDSGGFSPLDYAREYNVNGLVSMIAVLCNHRYSIRTFEGGG